MRKKSLGAAWRGVAAIATIFAAQSAFADHSENLPTASTFGTQGNPLNTQGSFSVANTPVLNRVVVNVDSIAGSPAGIAEASLRLTGPGGTPVIDLRLHFGSAGSPAAQSTVGASVPAAGNANGTWTYEFFETIDDSGLSATLDNALTNVTIEWQGPRTITPAPYDELFTTGTASGGSNRVGYYGTSLGAARNTAMLGWLRGQATATLGSGAVAFSPGTPAAPASLSGTGIYGNWLQDGFLNSGTTGAIRINGNSATRRDFVISPTVAIPSTGNHQVRFSLGLTVGATTTAASLAAGQELVVLISEADGVSWTGAAANRLATFNNSTPISNAGQVETIAIPNTFNGTNRRIGFYFGSTVTNNVDLFVDNFVVEPEPPTPDFPSSAMAGPSRIYQHRSGTYTFTLVNSGTAASTDTEFAIPLPAGLTYTPASLSTNFSGMAPGGDATYNGGLNRIEFAPQAIDAGATVTVSFGATATGLGSLLVEATIDDSTLGTPITRSVTTNVNNISSDAGSDAFYDVLDSYEPGGPVYSYIGRPGSVNAFDWSDDDDEITVESPFLFFVYGQPIARLRVGANGALHLNSATAEIDYSNLALSAVASPLFVAPWWDDLDFAAGCESAWWVDGTAPSRRLVLEWVQDHHNNDLANPLRFQAIFHEASQDVLFQYQDTDATGTAFDNGVTATVGIVGNPGTQVRQYAHNLTAPNTVPALEPNLAILFDALQPVPSAVVVGDAGIAEGASGTQILSFPVTISNPPASPFSFDWQTVDGSATDADNDFEAVAATTVNLPANTASTTLSVTVNGDTAFEPNESFSLLLGNPAGGVTIGGAGTATGSIANDDAPATPSAFYFDGDGGRFGFAPLAGSALSSVDAAPSSYLGGDFEDTTGTFWAAELGDRLVAVDPLDGSVASGPFITGLASLHGVISMSFNPADGLMYALTLDLFNFDDSQIGTLNLGTGAFTALGSFPVTGVALAHDAFGNAFVVQAGASAPYPLSLSGYTPPSTLAPIGALGRDSAAFLEMDFDPATNSLFMPILDTLAGNSGLYAIDTATGAATLQGSLYASAAASLSAFAAYRDYTPQLAVSSAFGSPTPAGTTNPAWDSTVNASIASPVTISAGERQVVTGYTGTGSAPTGSGAAASFAIRVPSTLAWNFQQQFAVTSSINPPGSGTVDVADGFYDTGTNLTVTATPQPGFVFVNFSGDLTGGSPGSLAVSAPRSYTANFEPVSAVADWTMFD